MGSIRMSRKDTPKEPDGQPLDLEEESTEDTGIRKLVKFLETQRKRPARGAQPAWQRVEDYKEGKRSKEDMDDSFDFDLEGDET